MSRRWMENSMKCMQLWKVGAAGNGARQWKPISVLPVWGRSEANIHTSETHFAEKTLFSIKVNSHRPWLAGEWICLTWGPALNHENTLFLRVAEVVTLKQKGLYLRFSSKCGQWRNEQENSQPPAAQRAPWKRERPAKLKRCQSWNNALFIFTLN